jgi:hypothetical protein
MHHRKASQINREMLLQPRRYHERLLRRLDSSSNSSNNSQGKVKVSKARVSPRRGNLAKTKKKAKDKREAGCWLEDIS